jgi:hypothetical protein
MSLLSPSKNPPWLASVREFCSARRIERAAEISAELANLGFHPVPDPDDEYAGILTLARED